MFATTGETIVQCASSCRFSFQSHSNDLSVFRWINYSIIYEYDEKQFSALLVLSRRVDNAFLVLCRRIDIAVGRAENKPSVR